MARFWPSLKLSSTEQWPSKRIIASYVFDWIVIVIIAAVGGGINFVPSRERAFSLANLDIAYPLIPESISVVTLFLVSLIAPAILMAIICMIMVPGTSGGRSFKAPHALRRKLWELYAAVTGIALSVAVAFFATQGLKKAYGKPRPHLLAVCNPDVSNIAKYVVGNYAQDLDTRWVLVDAGICRGSGMANQFQSFPSGHCSFAWSGLLYFSLFLCAKFSFTIPYLPLYRAATSEAQTTADNELLPMHHGAANSSSANGKQPLERQYRNTLSAQSKPTYKQAAAPPIYGIILVLIPISVAAYIASTRWSEYYHDGYDVFWGSLIGIGTAIISFRWFHLPLSRGHGWAWSARSKSRAFGVGLGVGSYVSTDRWKSDSEANRTAN